ncbi:MAG: hypothetical protein NZ898_16490, partial [Myxococcota bacterium]|nr:hypothetical protein [Myxococcota bacterium]
FDALAPTQFDPSARHMFVSMCDHDLYGGLGQPYPYNPHWGGTDTVDGALASMAAIHFVARGNGRHPGYPTSLVFLSGSSAGGVGAYHV